MPAALEEEIHKCDHGPDRRYLPAGGPAGHAPALRVRRPDSARVIAAQIKTPSVAVNELLHRVSERDSARFLAATTSSSPRPPQPLGARRARLTYWYALAPNTVDDLCSGLPGPHRPREDPMNHIYADKVEITMSLHPAS